MTDTVNRPGNEVWLHDMLTGLEEGGHLAEFCLHIGVEVALIGAPTAEIAWLAVKAHFTDENGVLDIAAACHAVLQFPPTMHAIADRLKPPES